MKKYFIVSSLFVIAFLWTACDSEKKPEAKFQKEYDLKEYGMEFKIKGPEDMKIEKKETLLPYEFTFSGTEFKVFLYGDAAEKTDRAALKQSKMQELKENTSYKFELVKEEDFGFIYTKQWEGDTTRFYDFVYVLLQGDNQFKFNSYTTEQFNLEQIEAMYNAVKQE